MADDQGPWMDKLLSILAAEGSVETKGPAIENATILSESNLCVQADDAVSLIGSKVCC